MSLAQTVRETLDCRAVAARYGLNPGRHGRVRCLFHDEKNPAMKLYDGPGGGYYCFACGAHGTVIDLTMKLFDIPARQAVTQLAADFGIAAGRPSARTAKLLARRRERENRCSEAWQELLRIDHVIREQAPKNIGDEPSDEWINAIFDRTYYENLHEYLCNKMTEERHERKRTA